jgi:hypothetical protein
MATVREQRQVPATTPETEAPQKFVLTFGAKASCVDGTQGRVVRVTVNSDSRRLERIVLQTDRPVRAYVLPAKLVNQQAGVLQIACSGPELARYDESSVLEVLPASALPPCYPPWQPLQQLQVDLQNPFGRLLVGERHLRLQPSEIELSGGQLAFGVDGLLGSVEGFVTEPGGMEVLESVLVAGHGRRRKALCALPVARLHDWRTLTFLLDDRDLDAVEQYWV